MIYDTLHHRKQYQNLHPGVAAALDFLADTDWAELDDGRYEVDGENVFVNVMRYETKMDNPTPERHEKYIDIFTCWKGRKRWPSARSRSWARWWRPGPRGTSGCTKAPGSGCPWEAGGFWPCFPETDTLPPLALTVPLRPESAW